MTTKEFFNKWNGKGIDFDHYYGFQCMDLAHQYAVEVNNCDIPSAPAAKDVWDKACPGYDKIKNTPTGVPQLGDIVIWGTAIGAYGHIAVFSEGNANSFISYEQNWPINSLCHFQNHNYTGVLGWLRLKVAPIPEPKPVFTDQSIIPIGGKWGNMELQAVRSTLNDMDNKIANYTIPATPTPVVTANTYIPTTPYNPPETSQSLLNRLVAWLLSK
jgi:hypothetical protein